MVKSKNEKISIESKINIGAIIKDIKDDAAGIYTAEAAATAMRPFVPQRTQSLVDGARFEPWEVRYETEYAGAVYVGGKGGRANFRKDPAIFASKEWDKAAEKAGEFEKVAKALQDYYKKHL